MVYTLSPILSAPRRRSVVVTKLRVWTARLKDRRPASSAAPKEGRRQCRDSNGSETETLRHAPEGMHARTPRIARTSGPLDRTQDCVLVELGVHSPISIHPIVSVCRCSYARYVSVCSLLACMMQGCLDVSGATPRGGVSPNDVSRDIVGPGGDDGLRPSKDGERRKLVRATRLDEGSGDGAGVSRDEGQSLGSP